MRAPFTETFGEFRPTALLFVIGADTPGDRVSSWRILRVGRGRLLASRESMVVLSSELLVSSDGGTSFTVISEDTVKSCNCALTIAVSLTPTVTLRKTLVANPWPWIFTSYVPVARKGRE